MAEQQIVIQENIALAPLTTLKVGGASRFFVEAQTERDLFDALNFAEANNLAVFVLGGGSNLLVSDGGFDGLVIRIALSGIEFYQDKTDFFVTAAAGEDWDNFVRLCVERNLAGIESLSGIPGTVGATPVQNVGAYGQEVSGTIVSVRAFDRKTKEIKTLLNADCGFAYRSSIFNTSDKNRFIVLGVTFCLKPNGKPALRYADLERFFAGKSEPSLTEVREAVLEIRAAKSMVISDADENRRSAGSFFKNPIVDAAQFAAIETTARQLNLITNEQTVPHFAAGAGNIKVSAAWLIEKSGFCKGYVSGGAGISTNHTLAIINRGEASAGDILNLVREIQIKVSRIFGVELTPEPIWLGI